MKKINLPVVTYAKVASGKKNTTPTEKQSTHRAMFKLVSQFSSIWSPILTLFLLNKAPRKKCRNYASSVAYKVTSVENHTAVINLSDFETLINAKTHQYASAGMIVSFNAVSQSIIAPDGDVVTYQIVAFDENSTPIGFNTVTFVSDGTAKLIDLPAIKGDAKRYDIMAYSTTLGEGTVYNGTIGEISGNNPEEIITAESYSVLVNALEKAKGTINGIQTGSFLVTP